MGSLGGDRLDVDHLCLGWRGGGGGVERLFPPFTDQIDQQCHGGAFVKVADPGDVVGDQFEHPQSGVQQVQDAQADATGEEPFPNHGAMEPAVVRVATAFLMRTTWPGSTIDRGRRVMQTGGMDHSPGFLKVVDEARKHVHEVTIDQLRERIAANPKLVLLDVREDLEWGAGHAQQAEHLGKGILERDIEKRYPDASAEIVMYCGGGFRSALTCDVAQRMGYKNVHSLIGGYKALVAAGWPMAK